MVSVNDVVAGRYRLLQHLGSGAMGQVWLAEDQLLHRQVAIKQLLIDPSQTDQVDVDRAMREARVAGRLNHPAAVAVHDVVVEQGRPMLVMEYVPGFTLAQRIRDVGPLAPAEAAQVLRQIAGALAAAHELGIIHRDIKPANILIGPDGRAKLADFGIARSGNEASLTSTGMMLGTIAYMAPEVADGSPATPASDMWSLGATLYAAVEGGPPFPGNNPVDALLKLVRDPIPVAGRAGPLGDLLGRLLNRDASARPSASAAAAELDRYAGPLTPVAAPEETRIAPPALPPTAVAPQWSAPPPAPPYGSGPVGGQFSSLPPIGAGRSMNNRTLAIVGAVVIALLVAGTIGLTVAKSRKDDSGKDTSASTAGQGASETPAAEESPSADPVKLANCGKSLAFLGAVSGPASALGQSMVGGIKLALDEFSEAHPDCTITLKEFDSQGSVETAPSLATRITKDAKIVGLIGPAFSGESLATGGIFARAGLPSISPSATNVTITQQGWTTYHRIIGNDTAQGVADAAYLTGTLGASSVFVVNDGTDYGAALAGTVDSELGGASAGTATVSGGSSTGSAVNEVMDSGADAVFFGGYYDAAGPFVKKLRQKGFEGTFMAGDGSQDPAFIEAAGASAAEGAVLSAPAGPAPSDFASRYRSVIGSAPGLYSTQAYDATNVFLAAFEAGMKSEDEINAFVSDYTGDGASGRIAFDSSGDLENAPMYAYVVSGGEMDVQNPTLME